MLIQTVKPPIPILSDLSEAKGILLDPKQRGFVLRKPALLEKFQQQALECKARKQSESVSQCQPYQYTGVFPTPPNLIEVSNKDGITLSENMERLILQTSEENRTLLADLYSLTGTTYNSIRKIGTRHHIIGRAQKPATPYWHTDSGAYVVHMSHAFNGLSIGSIESADIDALPWEDMKHGTGNSEIFSENLMPTWFSEVGDIVIIKGSAAHSEDANADPKDFLLPHRSPINASETGYVSAVTATVVPFMLRR